MHLRSARASGADRFRVRREGRVGGGGRPTANNSRFTRRREGSNASDDLQYRVLSFVAFTRRPNAIQARSRSSTDSYARLSGDSRQGGGVESTSAERRPRGAEARYEFPIRRYSSGKRGGGRSVSGGLGLSIWPRQKSPPIRPVAGALFAFVRSRRIAGVRRRRASVKTRISDVYRETVPRAKRETRPGCAR